MQTLPLRDALASWRRHYGVFGAHVVAVNSETGAVIAGAFAGWSCNTQTSSLQFDGSYDLERLPIGQSYLLYAEPLVGLAQPGDFSNALNDLCEQGSGSSCAVPPVNATFNPRVLPALH
jgi:hypothetical protein